MLYHEAAHAYDHYNNGCTSTYIYSGSSEWNTIHTNEESHLKTWYNSSTYASFDSTAQKSETFAIAIGKYFTDPTWLQTNCPQAYAYIQGLNIQ